MDLLSIPFQNNLGYDVSVLDSFNPDSPADAENNYLGHLTSLGTVKAKSTSVLKPLRSASVFVFQNASTGEPLARSTRGPLSQTAGYSVGQSDEDAMTATITFISFLMFNPDHPMTKAFYALWHEDTAPLMQTIDAFFTQYPDYQACTFQTYLMGITYISAHPEAVITPFPVHSLSGLVKHWGGAWPDGLPDITISHFSFSFKNNLLQLGIYIDLSTLPYETPQVADNVKKLGYGDTTVKVTLQINFQLSLGILGTRLTIDFDDFGIPVGDGKSISITKPEATIDINPLFKFVVFTLKGTIPFKANNTALDANISLTVDNEEAHIGAVIAGDKCSFPAPPVLKGLFFDEVGIGMGLFFTPPAFTFDLETKFHIGTPKSGNIISLDDDTAAMVFKVTDGIPTPLYLSFYVPRIDANELLELFTNVSLQIDTPILFSDLSFKWSESLMEAVVLPDGSLAPAGYGFSANVDIFSFGFHGDANLDLSSGLTANVEVSPINWKNVFKLTGDGKGYSVKVDEAGHPIKNNFIPTTQAEKDALAKATDQQIVAPGGACLIINTLSMPILHLNAKASLFDIADYAIQADINKSGITFLLDYGIVLKEKMTVTLSDFHNLAASFTYYINQSITVPPVAGMNLGTFTLSADVGVHFAITTSLSDVTLSVGGAFDFLSLHRSFGDFTADINITKITDFLKAIGDYIEQHAKDIFSDFLADAQQWANKVKNGFITGCDEVGSVIKNVWKGDSIAVAAIMKGAGYAIDDISRNIKNAWNCATTDVTYALKAVGYTADEIAVSLKNVFNAASQDVAAALKAMGFAVSDIGKAIKNCWNCGINDVSWALQQVGFSALEVGTAVKNAFNAASQDVAATLKKWGYKVEEIGGAIKGIWNCGINDVTWALNEVGFSPDQITSALRSAFNASAQDVISALKAFGVAYDKIANVLKNDFACDVRTCATYLKNLGYSATQIVGVLKNIYNLVYLDCTLVLKDVGILANDAAAGLQWVWAAASQDIGTGFKMVGYIAQDTANALKNVYNLAINDTAAVLKQAGYAASDVASALQGAFNTTTEAVADAMKQVGYAANDVKNAFESLGGDFKSFADTAWSDTKYYLNPSHW